MSIFKKSFREREKNTAKFHHSKLLEFLTSLSGHAGLSQEDLFNRRERKGRREKLQKLNELGVLCGKYLVRYDLKKAVSEHALLLEF